MRIAAIAGATALVLGSMFATPPAAQAGESNGTYYEAVGRAAMPGMVCPPLTWAIHPVGAPENGGLSGVLWYADMSGVSLARGMMTKDGRITLDVTSVSGAGPTGTVTGTRRADGTLMADLNGPGCAKLHIAMKPMELPMYNMAGSGG